MLFVDIQDFVAQWWVDNISKKYTFHNINHTQGVVSAVELISSKCQISPVELEYLKIAAWFHDIGYSKGAKGHESRSAEIMESFLQKRSYSEDGIQCIRRLIMATKVGNTPKDLLEKIMCDADTHHLGSKEYWDRSIALREELLETKGVKISDSEWVDAEIKFLSHHTFYTDAAMQMYNKRKDKNIRLLIKQRLRLDPKLTNLVELLEAAESKNRLQLKETKKSKKKMKEYSLGRGVETMFRNSYRVHINLSSIADNKANFMLTINSIIISIVAANLVPQFSTVENLIFPSLLLLFSCLAALIFAIMATRPKVTEGLVTQADIDNKTANLLFFGNFYKMPINDYQRGVMTMIRDNDFLYNTMIRDLYYLGVVLALKYKYLRISYTIFMIGIISAVVGFTVVFTF